jgi:putative ABC transport system substrate-binding protein
MVSRRALIVAAIGGATPFGTATAWAQQVLTPQPGDRVPHIGTLLFDRGKDAFLQGLHDAGYIEGRNIVLESRSIFPAETLPRFAAELVALKVEIIVASGSQAVQAARQATQSIPIVMTASSDPIGTGFVASLARPGGNVTGMSLLNPELSGKRLELLKEIAGGVSRVAVLWNPDDPPAAIALKETEDAARTLGIETRAFAARRTDDFDAAFASAIEAGPKAVVILSAPLMRLHMRRIATWALQNRLPSIFWEKGFPEAGGLMSYGPDADSLYRRSAAFVDKILKGAKPADLPVEQPTKFELVLNLKTAKALGLTVPQSILARADEVIE